MTHGHFEVIIDQALIFKFDFLFGRMHIDVDVRGIDFKKQDIKRIVVFRNQILEGHFDRMVQITAFKKALIDEKMLVPSGFATFLWLSYKTGNLHQIRFLFHRHQMLFPIFSHERNDTLSQIMGRQDVHFLIIMIELEFNLRMSQSDSLKFVLNMS